jgi:hypothetical protein
MSEEEKEYNIVLPELNSRNKAQCTGTKMLFRKGFCTHNDRTNILGTELDKINDELYMDKKFNIDDIIEECIRLSLITVTFHNKEGSKIDISTENIRDYFDKNAAIVENVASVKLKAKKSKIKPSRDDIDRIPAKLKNVESCIILRSQSNPTRFRILNGDSVETNEFSDNKIYKFDIKTSDVTTVTGVPQISSIQDQITEGVVYYVTFMEMPRKIIGASSTNNGSGIHITYLDDDAKEQKLSIFKQMHISKIGFDERNVDTINFISYLPYLHIGESKDKMLRSTNKLGTNDRNIEFNLKNSYFDMEKWTLWTTPGQDGGKIIHKSKKMRTTKKQYKKSNSSSKRRRYHRSKRVYQRR